MVQHIHYTSPMEVIEFTKKIVQILVLSTTMTDGLYTQFHINVCTHVQIHVHSQTDRHTHAHTDTHTRTHTYKVVIKVFHTTTTYI